MSVSETTINVTHTYMNVMSIVMARLMSNCKYLLSVVLRENLDFPLSISPYNQLVNPIQDHLHFRIGLIS